MIRITFLGTSASRPTVGRNVSALALQREGEVFLLDCGEGTQRQMMRFGTGFSVEHIFISHLHADHFLGVIGLIRTMALQGRTEPLVLYAPLGSRDTLGEVVKLGGGKRTHFPIEIREMEPGDRLSGVGYDVEALVVRHGTPALGFALREHPRPGRFDVEKARALGVPEGPLFGRLHGGEAIEVNGRSIEPAQVVGPPRGGRLVVYSGDTVPAPEVVEAAAGADLLIHEATFSEEEVARARETFHSTAKGAAEVARDAGVHRLYLTHLSARYSANPQPLEREAREVFPVTEVAYDGLAVEIGFESDGDS